MCEGVGMHTADGNNSAYMQNISVHISISRVWMRQSPPLAIVDRHLYGQFSTCLHQIRYPKEVIHRLHFSTFTDFVLDMIG